MNFPLAFPAWMPWWVPVAVLVPAFIYALLFLLMPFGVFGVKGRLDRMDARLDEIQGEIRALILRLPEVASGGLPDSDEAPPVPPRRSPRADEEPRRQPGREEPRFDWPRQPR
ncbi:MAG: hypothetical protein JOY70_01425 [Acidisphaera sp.]|nr:hypothetical protein [Acidisphaera sp.]MBV9813578.1 hypothetical protein [Acetobacteraceae bacterium]